MRFTKTFVPYGAYWSTPFCKWQGSLSHLDAISLAADTAKKALAARKIAPGSIDSVSLGITVLQKHHLYGGPWFSAMIGAEALTGPMIAQACATSARTIAQSAAEVDAAGEHTVLAVTADRCSNGAHRGCYDHSVRHNCTVALCPSCGPGHQLFPCGKRRQKRDLARSDGSGCY